MRIKDARKALFKLLMANTGKTNMLSTCLMAAALAARVLRAFGVAFTVQCGYVQDTGVSKSAPHVWLETPNEDDEDAPLVTDLTLLPEGARARHLLGTRTSLREEEVLQPQYTSTNMYAVDYRSVTLTTLQGFAADLETYVSSYLGHLKPEGRASTLAFIERVVKDANDESIASVTTEFDAADVVKA